MKLSRDAKKIKRSTNIHCTNLDADSFLRLPEVLGIYPVSKSTWYDGIRKGIFPQGVKLSQRTTAWRVSDIKKLLESVK